MTDRQLLQRLLDAMERYQVKRQDFDTFTDEITALNKRLAHCDRCGKRLGGEGDIHTCSPDPIGDAQDRMVAEMAAQPEQEPVAYEYGDEVYWHTNPALNDYIRANGKALVYATPPAAQRKPQYDKTEMNCFVQNLYDEKMREGKHGHYETMFHCVHQAIARVTPPAAQREWVGLTNEDIQNCYGGNVDDFARALLAKSKEKNT